MNIPKTYIRNSVGFLSIGSLLVSSLSAEWTIITDYEDGQQPAGYGEINTNPEGIGDGGQFVQEDPLNPENQVLWVTADTGEINFSNFHIGWFPLERPINDGEVVTYYMRHMKTGLFQDVVWGFASEDPPEAPSFYSFSAHHVNMQYSILIGGFFGVWNQNTEIFFPETEVWYEIWTVINHETDTYEIYAKGGEFADVTMVSSAQFQNGALTEPLSYFVTWAVTGTSTNPRGTDPMYFDDLYIDYTGMNLTTPEPQDSVGGWNDDPIVGWKFELDGGWYYSFLLGYFFESGSDWYYSLHHGWFYIGSPLGTASFAYSTNYGWTLLSTENGGWIYSYSNEQWINLLEPLP